MDLNILDNYIDTYGTRIIEYTKTISEDPRHLLANTPHDNKKVIKKVYENVISDMQDDVIRLRQIRGARAEIEQLENQIREYHNKLQEVKNLIPKTIPSVFDSRPTYEMLQRRQEQNLNNESVDDRRIWHQINNQVEIERRNIAEEQRRRALQRQQLEQPLDNSFQGLVNNIDVNNLNDSLDGAGIIDNIQEALKPIPSKLNNVSRRTLETYGNYPIQSAFLMRTPLSKTWTGALNAISFGQFEKLQDKHNFKVLYHVAFVGSFNNQNIIIEKNEVVNIDTFKQSDIKPDTETFRLTLSSKPTLSQIIDNTRKYMGDNKFYSYSALGNNNCQNMVMAVLRSNSMNSVQAENFIYQNIKPLANELLPHVSKITDAITQTGSVVSRLIGKGRTKDIDKKFINFVMNNGFRFI